MHSRVKALLLFLLLALLGVANAQSSGSGRASSPSSATRDKRKSTKRAAPASVDPTAVEVAPEKATDPAEDAPTAEGARPCRVYVPMRDWSNAAGVIDERSCEVAHAELRRRHAELRRREVRRSVAICERAPASILLWPGSSKLVRSIVGITEPCSP